VLGRVLQGRSALTQQMLVNYVSSMKDQLTTLGLVNSSTNKSQAVDNTKFLSVALAVSTTITIVPLGNAGAPAL